VLQGWPPIAIFFHPGDDLINGYRLHPQFRTLFWLQGESHDRVKFQVSLI
jgi:hypothetical protein